MDQSSIFGPFFAMLGLTLAVWVYMYARRISWIHANDIQPDQLTPGAMARLAPPEISNPSDNLKNLFEMPVLFYAVALYLYVTDRVDPAYLAAAWVFVAFRILHSLVHCTFNKVMLRFNLYLISSLALWYLGIRAALDFASR